MCGLFTNYVWISNLTLSLLDDTGWYEVNYSMAEPYPWGDGRSLGLPPLSEFPRAAPQLVFPKHYLCWENETRKHCNYDYLAKAHCSRCDKFVCPGKTSDDKAACAMREFVNPVGLPIRGDIPEFDYLWFKLGEGGARCPDTELNNQTEFEMFGETFGPDSMCAMSSLARDGAVEPEPRCLRMRCEDGRVVIEIGKESRTCLREGDELVFKGYAGNVTCPNGTHICAMKSFLAGNREFRDDWDDAFPDPDLEIETVAPDLGPEPDLDPEENAETTSWWSLANVGIAVVLSVIIVVALWHLCCKREPTMAEAMAADLLESRPPDSEPRLDIPLPDDATTL
jgi:hypothetical protein